MTEHDGCLGLLRTRWNIAYCCKAIEQRGSKSRLVWFFQAEAATVGKYEGGIQET